MQLTERDEALLQGINRFRLARTSDLVRYAFTGVRRDTSAARLRKLYDSRYLALLPPRPIRENVYRLGPVGRRHLERQGQATGRVPRGGHEHHLAIVRLWVTLAGLPWLGLARCVPDWELREENGNDELGVIPDLFALLRVDGEIVPVAFEVDLGTESVGVLAQKADRYRALWGRAPGLFGWERFGVAVVLEDPARNASASAAIKKAWVVPHVMWSSAEDPNGPLQRLLAEMNPPLRASP